MHNLPACPYRDDQMGQVKVFALEENVRYLNGAEILGMPMPYRDEEIQTPIVVIAVDSSEERRRIWEAINTMYVPPVELFIDTASGLDIIEITAWEPGDEEKHFLPSFEREDLELPCGGRSVAYNAFTAAGLVGGIVKAYSMGQFYPSHLMIDHRTWATSLDVDYVGILARRDADVTHPAQ